MSIFSNRFRTKVIAVFIMTAISLPFSSTGQINTELTPANKILKSEKFLAACTVQDGKNVAYDFSKNIVTTGKTTNSSNGSFNVILEFALSKSGQPRGYLSFIDVKNFKVLPDSVSDPDSFISDENIFVSDTLWGDSIRLKRTYKDEWHGIYTSIQYQDADGNSGHSYIAFTYPLKCTGKVIQ